MQSVYIREATPNDVALLSKLSIDTFYDTYLSTHLYSDLEDHVNTTLTEDAISSDFKNENICYLILCSDNEAIGYAKLDKVGNYELPKNSKAPLEVSRIYLLKSVQGKGLGKKLMEACEAYAVQHSFDALFLSTWEGNTTAIKFYNSREFSIYGETPFVMKSKTDRDWLLYKPLKHL